MKKKKFIKKSLVFLRKYDIIRVVFRRTNNRGILN